MVALFRRKTLKFAIPFLVFMVGGSIGLREFTSLRYRYSQVVPYDPKEEAKKAGIPMRKPEEVTLEAQYEELKKQNIEEWENKRIPRPSYYNMQ